MLFDCFLQSSYIRNTFLLTIESNNEVPNYQPYLMENNLVTRRNKQSLYLALQRGTNVFGLVMLLTPPQNARFASPEKVLFIDKFGELIYYHNTNDINNQS